MHRTPERWNRFRPATWEPDASYGHVYRRPRRSIHVHPGALVALCVAVALIYGMILFAQNFRMPSMPGLPERQPQASVRVIAPTEGTGASETSMPEAAGEPAETPAQAVLSARIEGDSEETPAASIEPLAETPGTEASTGEARVSAAGSGDASPLSPIIHPIANKRVWISGDGMANAVGAALLEEIAALDGIGIHNAIEASEPDWRAFAADEMARHDPEVAIFVLRATDAMAADSHDGYRAQAGEFIDALDVESRVVVIVGQPPAHSSDDEMRDALQRLNTAFADEASQRGAVFVDTWHLPPYVQVRDDDSLRITPVGGEIIAAAVLDALR